MRTPVRPDAPRRHPRRRVIALVLAALCAAATLAAPARAAPLALAGDSDYAAFADRLRAFADASRVRWVVAAKTRADAEAAVAALANRLAPVDRPLVNRVDARAFADIAPKLADSASPLAWMIAAGDAAGAKPLACSWQVAVSDPAFPTVGDGPLAVSLAPRRSASGIPACCNRSSTRSTRRGPARSAISPPSPTPTFRSRSILPATRSSSPWRARRRRSSNA